MGPVSPSSEHNTTKQNEIALLHLNRHPPLREQGSA